MLINPYPKEIVDGASGITVPDERHKIWQQGFEAGWKTAEGIVSKVSYETDDLKSFERGILLAFDVLPREKNKRR